MINIELDLNSQQLVINNLNVKFKNFNPIENINLSINSGETVALLGELGSGKSMTANAILQTLPPGAFYTKDSSIIFDNEDLLEKSEYEMRQLRGNEIAMIFQDPMSALNPVFTIGYQILEVLKLKNKTKKKSKKELYNKIIELLTEVGLENADKLYKSYPHQLSGGMRQRVIIAMALACKPKLLLADEPTTALDVTIAKQILLLLKKLQKKYNMAMLFITHNIAIVSMIADKIAIMNHGKIIEVGGTQKILKSPEHDYTKMLLSSQLDINTACQNLNQDNLLPALSVKDLTIIYPNKKNIKAVDSISFDLYHNSTLALVGESGSGKTSTAKALMGLVKAKGVIKYNDLMQIIFQDPYSSLNPRMIILEIIREGYRAIYKEKLTKTKVTKILEDVGLEHSDLYKYPHEFSGGQRQRIAIARALAVKPKILILDEPTSSLDVTVQAQILKLLKNIQQKYELSYLLISHDFSVVAYMANYVAVMYHGKIVEYGQANEILKNPQDNYTKDLLSAVPNL